MVAEEESVSPILTKTLKKKLLISIVNYRWTEIGAHSDAEI